MAGYVAKKCVEKTGCDTCRTLLLVPASECRADTQAAFTSFCDKGGLLYPSKELFEFVNYLEGVFTGCFSMNRLHADSILDVLSLVKGKDKIIGCAAHEAEVKAKILRFYIVTRLHFLIKGVNKAKEERRKMAQLLKVRREAKKLIKYAAENGVHEAHRVYHEACGAGKCDH
ncbi:hypothetical protein HPB51_013551 [Rhipicephalus microplus]|uniref:Uncharacterized protein n=1 Tax=Rhipicephalus microplus TaxID=6941 RepID=A0A9J6D9Z2_RHIMP|nr:hypothetical protein HPB51_013551 [Rhipicephalus microplus]